MAHNFFNFLEIKKLNDIIQVKILSTQLHVHVESKNDLVYVFLVFISSYLTKSNPNNNKRRKKLPFTQGV